MQNIVSKNDKGQLQRYFNAVISISLGILTDGVTYELYSDSDNPNMMDEQPFASFSISSIADGYVEDDLLETILNLRKQNFNPENVGAESRKKLMVAAFGCFLDGLYKNPDDDFVRFALSHVGTKQKLTQKVIENNRDILKCALNKFVDRQIALRLNIHEEKKEEIIPIVSQEEIQKNDGIVTTKTELKIYEYVKQRLAFLVKDDSLFSAIENVLWRDYKTTFKVFYKLENKGLLFNFSEMSDGKYRFLFSSGECLETTDLKEIDSLLLDVFSKRIEDFS